MKISKYQNQSTDFYKTATNFLESATLPPIQPIKIDQNLQNKIFDF
jgi:hypothetical protein